MEKLIFFQTGMEIDVDQAVPSIDRVALIGVILDSDWWRVGLVEDCVTAYKVVEVDAVVEGQ